MVLGDYDIRSMNASVISCLREIPASSIPRCLALKSLRRPIRVGFPISTRHEASRPSFPCHQEYTRCIWLSILLSEPCISPLDRPVVVCNPQNPHLSGLAKLSARKKAILPLYFSSNYLLALKYAQPGDRHNWVILSRMAANGSPGTAVLCYVRLRPLARPPLSPVGQGVLERPDLAVPVHPEAPVPRGQGRDPGLVEVFLLVRVEHAAEVDAEVLAAGVVPEPDVVPVAAGHVPVEDRRGRRGHLRGVLRERLRVLQSPAVAEEHRPHVGHVEGAAAFPVEGWLQCRQEVLAAATSLTNIATAIRTSRAH